MNKRHVLKAVKIILITVALGFGRLFLSAATDTDPGVRRAVTGKSQITPLLIAQESGEDQAGNGVPKISFTEMSYDFGTISQSGSVSHTFVLRNTGDGQLKIIKAKGS